ncbi:hypothetical protein [Bradyrhizobium sp. C9]|uniref:hypothetical protein n=1 Tax=Bradyrhizobium sp. C9 TaxID=142585 RepID=UPI0011784727|nr:hypothetical protein [Bradyrhizobium sp. C9]
MPTIKARVLRYEPSEEGLLRRLGAALVVHWDTLSEVQQVMFLHQANMMSDKDETVQLKEQLELFIKKYKATGED